MFSSLARLSETNPTWLVTRIKWGALPAECCVSASHLAGRIGYLPLGKFALDVNGRFPTLAGD